MKFSFALKRRAGRFLPALAGLVCLFVSAPAAGNGPPEMGNTPRAATWVTDGPVYAVVRTTDTVYICGNFHNVGPSGGTLTTVRNYIAALDASTGLATAWNPNANELVCALAVSSDGLTVYAGGYFTSIGGQTRNNIAALNASTGNATTWNPNANYDVNALAVSGTTVYVGGYFTYIGGQIRNTIAALDATVNTNNATAWNPNANYGVNALAVSGTTVYAGGYFTSIGGQTRNNIAALDATVNTNNATAWNPNANGEVYALAVWGTTVYAGGAFTTVNGSTTRNYIAALDATGNAITAWNPNANDVVLALAVSGTTVYAGGYFSGASSIGGQTRNRIAALNASTGVATDWNPNANGEVYALAVWGTTTVYAGGEFNNIGGATRNCLAALDATGTGNATAWDPNAGSTVNALAVSYPMVYAGGIFTIIGGQTRNRLAALDATVNTNNATAWNPNANDLVRALAVSGDGSTVYAGGDFTIIGGVSRTYFAQFSSVPVTPAAPTVTATGDSQLGVTVSADANPESTVYAIRNETSGNWVQANGSGGPSPVWMTRAGWGTVTVTGLARLTLYRFTVTARNDGGETAVGPEGSASTLPVGLSMMSVE